MDLAPKQRTILQRAQHFDDPMLCVRLSNMCYAAFPRLVPVLHLTLTSYALVRISRVLSVMSVVCVSLGARQIQLFDHFRQ
jgi:hypothetical protein